MGLRVSSKTWYVPLIANKQVSLGKSTRKETSFHSRWSWLDFYLADKALQLAGLNTGSR